MVVYAVFAQAIADSSSIPLATAVPENYKVHAGEQQVCSGGAPKPKSSLLLLFSLQDSSASAHTNFEMCNHDHRLFV